MTELIIFTVAVTSLWVAVDAPEHRLSRTWGLGCLALWIVAFPMYLVERKKADRLDREAAQASIATPSGPPPGWYPDAQNPEGERWWEGGRWSGATRPKP